MKLLLFFLKVLLFIFFELNIKINFSFFLFFFFKKKKKYIDACKLLFQEILSMGINPRVFTSKDDASHFLG